MSVTDYASLKTEMASWLYDRSDLTDRIPVFIQFLESQLNRKLRTRRMVTRATATVTGEYLMLPNGFLGAKYFFLDGLPPIELDYAPEPEDLVKMKATRTVQSSDKPFAYTVVGEQFAFWPVPQASYTGYIGYYEKIPALTDVNTSNWVMEDHPDLYLYGSLLQSAPWLKEDERIQTWASIYGGILNDIETADKRQTSAPSIRMPERFNVP